MTRFVPALTVLTVLVSLAACGSSEQPAPTAASSSAAAMSGPVQLLDAESRTTLLFPWYPMERQVMVTGRAERIPDSESDLYFATRPYGSQIGAWASHQSEVLASRHELQSRFDEISARYPEGSVPRPPHWGGFSITPEAIEFWQGRHSRLHDRIRFTRDGNHWQRVRLNP